MNYFTLVLDTTGPDVTINVPPYALSSGELDIVIEANEGLESSYQEFTLIDSLGQHHPFILSHFDTYFKGKISLGGLPLGVATIVARVRDNVLNLSPIVSKTFNIAKGARVKISSSYSSRSIRTDVISRGIRKETKSRIIKAVIR